MLVQNFDCGYTLEPPHRGGSDEYPQSMLWIKNKKKYVCPRKPQFHHIKWSFRVYFLHGHVFLISAIEPVTSSFFLFVFFYPVFFYIYIFFCYSVLRPFQDYFSSYEMDQYI